MVLAMQSLNLTNNSLHSGVLLIIIAHVHPVARQMPCKIERPGQTSLPTPALKRTMTIHVVHDRLTSLYTCITHQVVQLSVI